MAGRTMTLIYRGDRITVCEGTDGVLEMRFGKHRVTPEAKSFPAATNEARRWLLNNGGGMKGDYNRRRVT